MQIHKHVVRWEGAQPQDLKAPPEPSHLALLMFMVDPPITWGIFTLGPPHPLSLLSPLSMHPSVWSSYCSKGLGEPQRAETKVFTDK